MSSSAADAKMIADVSTQLEAISIEPSSQFQYLSDDYRRRLRYEVRQAVWAWMRAGDETDVKARFDFAVDVLLSAGAYFSAAVQEGDGCVEPAHLAASAYRAAQSVIDAPDLREEARELFREVSNPRPAWEPPPEEREAVERFKELIVSHLTKLGGPVRVPELELGILGEEPDRKQRNYLHHARRILLRDGTLRRTIRGMALRTWDFSAEVRSPSKPSDPIATTNNNPSLVPEETIGVGGEKVYVYFFETERKLANHEGRDWWPCKVGYTAGSLAERIAAQRPITSTARAPVIGLEIMVIAHPSPPADQAEAAPFGAARAARMASSRLRPLRRPVATVEQMSA